MIIYLFLPLESGVIIPQISKWTNSNASLLSMIFMVVVVTSYRYMVAFYALEGPYCCCNFKDDLFALKIATDAAFFCCVRLQQVLPKKKTLLEFLCLIYVYLWTICCYNFCVCEGVAAQKVCCSFNFIKLLFRVSSAILFFSRYVYCV